MLEKILLLLSLSLSVAEGLCKPGKALKMEPLVKYCVFTFLKKIHKFINMSKHRLCLQEFYPFLAQ